MNNKKEELNIEEESAKALRRLKRRIVRASKMEPEQGREILAESLAMLIVQQRVLYNLILKGNCSSELHKSFPTYSTRIKAHCVQLGLATVPTDDDDDEEFLNGI